MKESRFDPLLKLCTLTCFCVVVITSGDIVIKISICMEWVRVRVQLTPRACASGTRSVVVRLSVGTKTPVLQIQAVMLVLNTFKLCKTLKTALSVLLFARYTLQTLKSCVLSWHRGHAMTTPRYLATLSPVPQLCLLRVR